MINSEFGDLKTDTKKSVQKIELNFEDRIYEGRKFRMKFFPWIRTSQLKKQLVKDKYNDKHKHLTQNDIRLFCKNIQLAMENKNPFELYKIQNGSTVIVMKNSNSNNTENGVINPYQIFQHIPQEITSLILNVQSGLNAGRKPKLASEGTSGTYFLQNNQKKVVAVYKPYDEQPYTPNNPRGYTGEVGSPGIRKGILSGECATREVAVYLLDAVKRFHGVPSTTYVQFYHPCFNYRQLCETPLVCEKECNLNKARTKHGSLQEFVQYNDVVGNLGSHQFDVAEVHKIAILDLRILNCDRNEANILVVKKLTSGPKGTIKSTTLVPIDHGLAFPDNFQIYQYQSVWMGYKQVQMPMSEASLNYIDSIDPVKDSQTLREKLGFREICLRNFRIAQIFLKKLAKANFTLYQIGKFAYREDDSDWSSSEEQQQQTNQKSTISQLQKLVLEAQFIYNTVKNNGMKSTAEFQIDFIKSRKNQEEKTMFNKEYRQINSQQSKIEIGLSKKSSKLIKQTSIEKVERAHSSKSKRPRNISLPNLKKKPSNRDRRLRLHRRKTKGKGQNSKDKGEKWGELFFHYFSQIVDRFVTKKLELKQKNMQMPKPGRGRLFSQKIDDL